MLTSLEKKLRPLRLDNINVNPYDGSDNYYFASLKRNKVVKGKNWAHF